MIVIKSVIFSFDDNNDDNRRLDNLRADEFSKNRLDCNWHLGVCQSKLLFVGWPQLAFFSLQNCSLWLLHKNQNKEKLNRKILFKKNTGEPPTYTKELQLPVTDFASKCLCETRREYRIVNCRV